MNATHKTPRDPTAGRRTPTRSRILAGVFGATTLFLLLVNGAGLRLFGGEFDPSRFGTVGDWFSGLAASTAIVFAWLSLIDERQKAAELRVEADPVQRERVEASRVYVWVATETDATGAFVTAVLLTIHNDTPVPVYQWSATEVETGRRLAGGPEARPLFPGDNRITLALDQATRKNASQTRVALHFVAKNGEHMIRYSDGAWSTERSLDEPAAGGEEK